MKSSWKHANFYRGKATTAADQFKAGKKAELSQISPGLAKTKVHWIEALFNMDWLGPNFWGGSSSGLASSQPLLAMAAAAAANLICVCVENCWVWIFSAGIFSCVYASQQLNFLFSANLEWLRSEPKLKRHTGQKGL